MSEPYTAHIYTIADPETKIVFYVGKTIQPVGRFGHHYSVNTGRPKDLAIKAIRARGLRPVFAIVETIEGCVEDWQWQEREGHWVEHFRSLGIVLTNLDSGGTPGCNHRSEETKRKVSLKNKGRKMTEEQKARMRAACVGRRPSAEALRRSIEVRRTPESRERARLAKLGKKRGPHSAKTIAKMSKPRPHFRHTEEMKRRLAEISKARKQTPEARAKVTAALKERWARIKADPKLYAKELAKNAGRKHSEESKRLMSEHRRATWLRQKAEREALTSPLP